MTRIRLASPEDEAALSRIALLTGDSGADASGLYADPDLLGLIFAIPYARLSPANAFVAEDDAGVAGYIVGALDTPAFATQLERSWWPTLRARYADPTGAPETWSRDQLRAYLIHHPHPTPKRVVADYPSHLHINLLPRLQGQGMGRALMDRLLATLVAMGSPGVHLGVSPVNARARRFYRAYGFAEVERPAGARADTVWMTLRL